MNKKIVVFGLGYVGLSLSVLLAQKNDVVAIDVVKDKIDKVNKKISPIVDKLLQEYLSSNNLNLKADIFKEEYIKKAEYFFIATPTNFNEETKQFDVSTVENVIQQILKINKKAKIVIKSTLSIGFTSKASKKYKTNLFFSPEFLREGRALEDNLYPSRIIVGCNTKNKGCVKEAHKIIELLKEASLKEDVKNFVMSLPESEAVKLFANSYLAMRVAFFNEMDTFCEKKKLNTQNLLSGVCSDPRIGDFYNNPSFGYGGYCLPKDTKQLRHEFCSVPNSLIKAVVDTNKTRKKHIVDQILKRTDENDVIGFYRMNMKTSSDNCRFSAIIDILDSISKKRKVIVYEPSIVKSENYEIENNIDAFLDKSTIIIANRADDIIKKSNKPIYTRDIFFRD